MSLDYSKIHESLSSLENVVRVHDLRVWSLTVDQIAMTAHLAVNPISDDVKEDILQQATSYS